MKFEIGQIYYAELIDVLFLVVDIDEKNNRGNLFDGYDSYSTTWLNELSYIGEL